MTVQERKEKSRILKRKRIMKRRITLAAIAIMFITMGSVVCGSIFSSAKNPALDVPQYKYYKSITIEQGDSLWSLAQEYNNNSNVSTDDYIDEIVQVNGLKNKTIHAGQHIVIAYYDTELH